MLLHMEKSHDEPAIKITWFLSGTRRPHLLTGGFLFANKSDVEFHVLELKERIVLLMAWTLKYHINLDAFRVAFCNVYEIDSHNFLPSYHFGRCSYVRAWRQLRKRNQNWPVLYVCGINCCMPSTISRMWCRTSLCMELQEAFCWYSWRAPCLSICRNSLSHMIRLL